MTDFVFILYFIYFVFNFVLQFTCKLTLQQKVWEFQVAIPTHNSALNSV